MPDPSNTSLITFNNWTLRIREATQKPSRLLLLLHGYTGDENSMWVFTHELPKQFWMIAPRAPHPTELTGYSWRPFFSQHDSGGNFGRPSLQQMIPSAEVLIRLVDEYQASAGIEAVDFDVMGFSQGGAMSNVLAFLYPHRIRKIGILAGFVPDGLEKYILRQPLAGKTVFVTHGTKDEMVPIERARSSMELLEQAGAKVVYCEDDVAHKVSANCMRTLRSYFED